MAISIRWPGLNGRILEFEGYPIGTSFNRVAGVYVVTRLEGQKAIPLYVGQAEDLFDRLSSGSQSHDGLERARKLGATHISVRRAQGLRDRLDLETELRHSLDPPCNRQGLGKTG